MSSLRKQDRKSLCAFTFADGRQCRTPRSPNHPRFCSDHARKASQARTANKLARDLSYFFSGEYLSACDLSAALGRLIIGVARGDIKPRSARTLAYLSQTLLQTIHVAEDEYIEARGADSWRGAVRNSIRQNHDYRYPSPPEPSPDQTPDVGPGRNLSRSEIPTLSGPGRETGAGHAPQAQPVQPPINCHSEPARLGERSEESAFSESRAGLSQTPNPAQQPTPSPRTPLPSTASEFVQQVVARLNLSRSETPTLSGPGQETAEDQAPHGVPGRNLSRPCRETGDLSSLSTQSASATQTDVDAQQPPSPNTAQARPSPPKPAPTRDPRAVHFDHSCRLLVDGKPF